MQYLYKKLLRKVLFKIDPEFAHCLSLNLLSLCHKFCLSRLIFSSELYHYNKQLNIAGLTFKNRVGIAAGLDKDAEYIDALADLGVGYIEVGTTTPRPQLGNPKPRLFRLEPHEAIINRMGFNNKGVLTLIDNIKSSVLFKRKQDNKNNIALPLIGINIGKNFDTSNEFAINDYLVCLQDVYQYADYITINISSPNTKNLRDLQKEEFLRDFLQAIKTKQSELAAKYSKYKPIALKISPDLSDEEIRSICDLCYTNIIDILIISNTTVNHELLYDELDNKIEGGLSGKPILEKSNQVLLKARQYLDSIYTSSNVDNLSNHKVYIIGVGGISCVDDAKSKINNGADLIQVYTGLIYQGPQLIQDLIKYL